MWAKLILLRIGGLRGHTLPLHYILVFQEKGQFVHEHNEMEPLKQMQILWRKISHRHFSFQPLCSSDHSHLAFHLYDLKKFLLLHNDSYVKNGHTYLGNEKLKGKMQIIYQIPRLWVNIFLDASSFTSVWWKLRKLRTARLLLVNYGLELNQMIQTLNQ